MVHWWVRRYAADLLRGGWMMAIRWKSTAFVRMVHRMLVVSSMLLHTGRQGQWAIQRLSTYILDTESGVSLKAAGYVCEGRAGGLEWNGERKPKMANQYPHQMKTRWVKKIEKEGMNGR